MATFAEVVTKLQTERGLTYLDQYVAREFAQVSGRPETEVLAVLRRQEKFSLSEESGRGKYGRARERACQLLAFGWDNDIQAAAPELLAFREFASAYATLSRREKDAAL